MKEITDYILNNEEVLMDITLQYAKERNYTKYTSTLKEAWRQSISGLSDALAKAIENDNQIPEMGPDDDFTKDQIAQFGIQEARKHRSRGVTVGMFLSLIKYYQQAYLDLIKNSNFNTEDKEYYSQYIKRCFDHIELGFTVEWAGLKKNQEFEELQEINRRMTNEKNKYLTVFESIYDPIILVDRYNHIENINHRVTELFFKNVISGGIYYGNTETDQELQWLRKELETFTGQNKQEILTEKTLDTNKGQRIFLIKFRKMLDISEKYSGTVIIFYDITDLKQYEKELKIQRDKLEEYAYKDQLTGVANRRTGLMTLKKELSVIENDDTYLSVCYIDIDGLKSVNDTYGHAEGDELIKNIAAGIKNSIRQEDCVSRMGGDEFLIIFPNCRETQADRIIHQIYDRFEKYNKENHKPYQYSFSYGVQEVSKEDNLKSKDILKSVDVKMYQNKLQRKSR